MSAKLSVSGTQLIDGLGNPVKLISVNVDGNEYTKIDYGTNDYYFTSDDLSRMKARGANCFEACGLGVGLMQPSRGNIDPNYLSMVDRLVNLAETQQVYIIVNFDDMSYTPWASTMPNWMLDGHGYGSAPYSEATVNQAVLDFWDINVTKQNDNRQAYIDMWVYLANRYKNKQYAMFGLANEPFSHCPITTSAQSLRMGNSYATIMEQWVDAIHLTGANNLIFIDKPYVWFNVIASPWLNDVKPVNRNGIVWEDHLYIAWAPVTTIPTWKTGIDTMVAKYVGEFGKPFYLGEYAPYPDGPYPANISEWNSIWTEMVNHLKTKGIGYAWHTWAILYGEVYTRDNPARTFKTEAESETFLSIAYSGATQKKYVFTQWQDGTSENPKIIQV